MKLEDADLQLVIDCVRLSHGAVVPVKLDPVRGAKLVRRLQAAKKNGIVVCKFCKNQYSDKHRCWGYRR